MIRRLVLVATLVTGVLLAGAAPAGADLVGSLCAYRGAPLHQGLCVRL